MNRATCNLPLAVLRTLALLAFLCGPDLKSGLQASSADQSGESLYDMLRQALARGADLQDRGEPEACYRLFADSLRSARAKLADYPDLQQTIDAALADAKRLDSVQRRILALREVLVEVRTEIGPYGRKMAQEQNRPSTRKAEAPAVADKKPETSKPPVVPQPGEKVIPEKEIEYWTKVAGICDGAGRFQTLEEGAREMRRLAKELDKVPAEGVAKDTVDKVRKLARAAGRCEEAVAEAAAFAKQHRAPSPLMESFAHAWQGDPLKTPREPKADEAPLRRALAGFLKELRQWEESIQVAKAGQQKAPEVEFFLEIWLAPKDAKGHVCRGEAYWLAGDTNQALADFNEAIRLNRRFTIAYLLRARARASREEYARAIEDCTEAIRLDAKYTAAYAIRAASRFRIRQFDPAIADCNQALKLNPNYALAYAVRGGCYSLKKGEHEQGISDCTQAIKLEANFAFAYTVRGLCYARKGVFNKASADLKEAIELNPKDHLALSSLAWLLATWPETTARDGKRAVEYARRAAELTKYKNADALDTLATAYAETGQFGEAVQWAEKALALAEKDLKPVIRAHLQAFRQGQPFRSKRGNF